MPTTCCIAPETPKEKYNFGLIVLPELPTCLELGSHPASTTGLLAETSAPKACARLKAMDLFSSFSIPLPTETIKSALSKSTSDEVS